ncbi:MAG: type II toxin-antitoxin system HicB family antitoxin [Deltaproteobacteria bacterium]|nr:type II toxin-antitoxin system HicB family antitoxin [Deltaproteobacteria bacterium]
MKFSVVIEKVQEGGYVVSCPAIKGCHSQGDTVEEALKNIKEAFAGCLKTLNQRARKVARRRRD